ncbi:MAG TPA: RNA polymerase sigma factor [Longimicrobiales bacterium]|nr:RNA polymerase sigma factor [Longimicrobiales bacterium]
MSPSTLAEAPSHSAGPPDAQLVARVLAGEREAFSSLVRRHQAELYRYARNLRIDHDSASDLVQDALVTAYSRLTQCTDPARFRFWLLRILRNRCLDWLRDIRRRAVDVEDVTLVARGTPHEAASGSELRQTLARALDALPVDLREAFLMKHHEGRSYEEMAELAAAGVSAMKMRVHRAREALREALVDAGVERPK